MIKIIFEKLVTTEKEVELEINGKQVALEVIQYTDDDDSGFYYLDGKQRNRLTDDEVENIAEFIKNNF